MIIYLLVKLLLSYWLIIKKKWIKDQEKLFLFFDLMIVIVITYLLLMLKNGFHIMFEILMIGVIFIIIFLLYKGLNYIEKNNEKILVQLKKYIDETKQKKIKNIFLKPIVSKSIYYFIWMLPWNIMYWIYFWIQENGWYARVWISSTRDIILFRIFKWDSREYFYNLFEKLRKGKMYKIRYYVIIRVQEMCCRIMYFIYLMRESILKYIWIRIIVYMYLSMFYVYILLEIQILNKILFYVLIIMELLFFYFTREIIEYYEEAFILVLVKKGKIENDTLETIDYLKYPFGGSYINKWVKNKFIWDRTLGNSISLNILYKYILYVNKNTKGYFDRQMNIMTRLYREKYLERKSILWDVLPRTRYVIISMKNEGFFRTKIEGLDPDFSFIQYKHINLINNKNLYLGYYEKTYSKTSLIMLMWILRINKFYWALSVAYRSGSDFYTFYKLDAFCTSDCNYSYCINMLIFMYIYKFDKRLVNEEYLFGYLLNEKIDFYNEENYFYNFGLNIYENKNDLEISKKICSLKNYKKMFKIMGRIMLYEEDNIIWNENLQKSLNEFYNSKNLNRIVNENYEFIFKFKFKNVNAASISVSDDYFDNLKEIIKNFIIVDKEELFDFKDFRYFFEILDLKGEELKVLEIWCDKKNIEEVLNILIYYLIKKNIYFSENIFYDKGNKFYDVNFSEINFEEILDYKWE